jgi:predicted metal-dependent enzyme (double-stranded beta helix superfamily)
MKQKPLILTRDNLENSRTVPEKIRSYLIAKIGRWQIKYVEWDPGVSYPEHTDEDEAYIFLIAGDISAGPLTLKERTSVKFHKGFHHEGMQSKRGARFIFVRPLLNYKTHAAVRANTATFTAWNPNNLQRSEKCPDRIRFGVIAKLEAYLLEYVTWQPDTVYPDHVNLSRAHIHLIKGDISDGEYRFKANTTITFPKGFRHVDQRSENGAEFVLVWKGSRSIKVIPAQKS